MTEQEINQLAMAIVIAMKSFKASKPKASVVNVTFVGSVSEPAKAFFESRKYFNGTTIEILSDGVAVTVSCDKALKLGSPAKELNLFLEKQGFLPTYKKFSKESAQVEQTALGVKYIFTLVKA